MLGMETITNKEVNVRLDNEKGTLCLTGLLAGTMVFLYDSQGELRGKHKFALPSLTMEIPQPGTYVLVMKLFELPTGSSANYIFRNIKKGLPNMFLFNDLTPIRVQTNSDRSDF